MSGVLRIVATGLLLVLGCTSPETSRTRGGGSGADIGNRDKLLEMHEGAQPFWKTPKIIPTKHPPLAPASQADERSRQ